MRKNKYYIVPVLLILVSMQFGCLKKPDVIPQTGIDNRPLLTILKNNYAFSMLYSALERTGLDKTLEGNGPFTILAPDNDAFANSGISVDSLASIDTATLKKLIGYHIIGANLPYSAIPQAIDFPYESLAGPVVYFSEPQMSQTGVPTLHINGVTVNKLDIQAANGYIMVLDRVLYYPATSVKDLLEGNPRYSYFTAALKKFGLLDQLDKTGPFTIMAPSNDAFLQNGIDEAAINALDTVHYRKFLFNAYILSPYRFFSADVIDAPVSNNAPPGVVTPDFIQVMRGDIYNPVTFGLFSLDWKTIQYYQAAPYYGNAYIYGPPVQMADPDHLALNGIVHGLNGIVMPPDSARIQ